MNNQKWLKLLECFLFLKQKIALWHSLILIQLNMPLYLLFDAFLEMRVLAPEI